MTEVVQEPAAETEDTPVEEPQTPGTPEGDPEPVEEPEEPQEPPQPQPQGMSERELEEVRRKLERSATTWRNRVSELLGEEANYLAPCELCDPIIPGFHFPAEVETARDPVHARLLDVLRTPGEPEYMPDPNTRECGVCGGLGKTLTKGRVPGKTQRVCRVCKGQGYLSNDPADQLTGNGTVDVSGLDLPSEEPLVSGDADIWGSPRLLPDGMENPNYGKMPQYKNPSLP
jgi:hypothetical protein